MPQVSELCAILAKNFGWHKARLECLTRLLVSLMMVSTVNLTRVALSFGGKAKSESRYRRLKRFFTEVKLDAKRVAETVAGLIGLPDEPWVIIFDRTRWDLGKRANNLLVLSVGLGDSAVPLFWKNIDKRGNSHAEDRRELLEQFFEVFGRKRIRLILGDREFASSEFMRYLQRLNILYCIRVKDNSDAKNSKGRRVKLRHCCRRIRTGETWYGTKGYVLWGNPVTLVALRIEDDLVVLATTLPAHEALPLYARRWEIETSFAALKSRGFCLEDTHMVMIEKTEKWLAILALAFAWAYRTGQWLEKQKATPLKAHGRKAISCFRRGFDCIRQSLFDVAHPLKNMGNHLNRWFPLRRKERKRLKTPKKFIFCPVP
jgi:Transposase DDE domain